MQGCNETYETRVEVDAISHYVCQDNESFEHKFILSVVFRCMRQIGQHDWELDSFSNHVNIEPLDATRVAGSRVYIWNYKGHRDVKIEME